ncbi:MAG: PP2C family protein-serine/threonine phosphatase [Candidatus Gracilibacteria bacterium]|nr:PP2C family protein-serine/threonine phosphatase [Candidatus Gracilibacteria bacterium]
MFGLFKNKNVDTGNIKQFDSALKAIEIFIMLSEWEKGKKALKEIEFKEKDSLSIVLEKIDQMDDKDGVNEKEKIRLTNELKKKQKKLNDLYEILEKKEEKYNQNVDAERFKIRFKKIKDEIEVLMGNRKSDNALALLQKFLEENAEKPSVVKFYNKEKKLIIKSLEKEKKKKEEKMKSDARLEAMTLIGKTVNLEEEEKKINPDEEANKSIFAKLKDKINFYKRIKERVRKKKLLDEINLLIEEDSKIKNDLAARKLANIHKGLVKELSSNKMLGYELYGKILGADKISGDTFGFVENDNKYNFFLGDATGHGIRAGFIITLLSRLFNKYVKDSSLSQLTYEINNGLKQDLKSRNFITGIFFEIYKQDISTLNYVGMGHEPMLIFRKKTSEVERLIPGGLAAGIRLINKPTDIKVKTINLNDGDVLLTYSDGIVESKDFEGQFYSITKLEQLFNHACKTQADINSIYEYLIEDLKSFRGGANFDDDVSLLLVKRDSRKDIIDASSKYIQELKAKEGLKSSDIRKLKGKTIEDIDKELEVLKKKKETERIIKSLEGLYYTGEILKLKQEAIRYIKEGYIDKKINFYLKKAIDNEKSYKVEQKNQKVVNKYNILEELLKKGDYDTVISEAEEIISKDGNM